ncbi:MAG: hypothetical protein PHV34_09125 [Verrucomicrobiae bacterium]|nr:hypothetical protein [Verrucomicrobiae bacterium]
MRNTFFEKWRKLRGKGKWNFILIYGVLLWGIGSALLFSLIFPLGLGWIGERVSFMPVFVGSVILFPLGGITWGYFVWMFNEKAYKKENLEQALFKNNDF